MCISKYRKPQKAWKPLVDNTVRSLTLQRVKKQWAGQMALRRKYSLSKWGFSVQTPEAGKSQAGVSALCNPSALEAELGGPRLTR